MFGVNHNAVVYLLEQLYGAQLCRNYKFRYQQYTRKEEEEVFNSCSSYDIFSPCKYYEEKGGMI